MVYSGSFHLDMTARFESPLCKRVGIITHVSYLVNPSSSSSKKTSLKSFLTGTVSWDFQPLFFCLKDFSWALHKQAKTVSRTFSFWRRYLLVRYTDTNPLIFKYLNYWYFVFKRTQVYFILPDCSRRVNEKNSKFTFDVNIVIFVSAQLTTIQYTSLPCQPSQQLCRISS